MKVIVAPSSFAAQSRAPLDLLEQAGVEVVPNPVGRRWTEEEALEFLPGHDGLLAGLEPLNRRVLSSVSGGLRAVARVGIGMSNVDLDAAKELGIKVSNTPDGPTEAVAELTLSALLYLARDMGAMNQALHEGNWSKKIGRSLKELTVLVVGLGRIGRHVAEVLRGLGCRIVGYDPFLPDDATLPGIERVSLARGLAEADAVTLHASGEDVVLGAAEFAQCRPGVMILNSARGGLVDENALVAALESGQVSKAWFDAFWEEPYAGALTKYPQVLLTPHAATYTKRCRLSMETEAAQNLLRDLGLVEAAVTS